ncbi:1-phosphofructokinase [Halomonas sp. PBN3]|uniref:1-phosphofructokinase n=1 Tax=Halomonas sp. PBN3 TaxID=1397528 RepID=UPI0003B7F79D|nr:1-phosphofructokinase [Halomonas sp. PBN3]ERS87673.1 1-phosphofructokinase [Halomonas sp. PBN3]
MARLLTLTLNPALDLSVSLERLVPGTVNRTRETHLTAAGKGVNVARVLVALGHQVTVSGFLGADNDGPFLRAFEALGVEDAFLRVPGETRINAKLSEAYGRVTDINGPGAAIGDDAWQRLLDWLAARLANAERRPAAVVIAGSLPPGVTPERLAALIEQLRGAGLPVWVDTSGEALGRAIAARPTGVKPNEQELAEWAGQALTSPEARIRAALRLYAAGVEEALLSAGPDGVLWVSSRGAWQAVPPRLAVASTVGAGDTLLAALLHGVVEGHTAEQTLRLATALSAESVRHVGVGDPRATDFPHLQQQTRVRRLNDVDAGGAIA